MSESPRTNHSDLQDTIQIWHEIKNVDASADSEFSVAELYHEASKQQASDMAFYKRIDYFNKSALGQQLVERAGKHYACAYRYALPPQMVPLQVFLTDAMTMRGSVRRFTGDPIALADLSALLKYGNGFVYGTLDGRRRRAIPSGGALYPAEVYVLPLECDLLPGAYHYDPHSHELARFAETAAEPVIAGACATGMALATASVAIVVSGCFERQRIKYGERAYRFTLLECGHLMQNLLLLAAGLGLGALPVGGFIDDQINNYLGLDGCDEAAVYLLLLGAIERK